jgi:uncharacterized protein
MWSDWYERHRLKIYPALVLLIYVCWITFMTATQNWSLFRDYWPATITMMLGSFVAGATAEGGGAVAYPVFTKVLNIASTDARTFALMIQSFGMGMASIFIITRRIRFMPRVVLWVSLGGLLGHLFGAFYVAIPSPYPKVLFTFVTSSFGVALFLSTYVMKARPRPAVPNWNARHQALFFGVGVFGGLFASQVGSGIDAVTFMVLTLAFGVNEKVSTPTTVLIMAINSWIGFFLHGVVLQDIGNMWNYWLVAVQIVIIGAPLGAFVTSKVNRHVVINFLLFLISVELVTTLWLVPFETATQIVITATAVITFALAFWLMLRYRNTLPPPAPDPNSVAPHHS